MVSKLANWAKGARVYVLVLSSILAVVPLLNWIGLSCFVYWFLDEDELPRKVLIAFVATIAFCLSVAIIYSDMLPIITLILVFIGVAMTWLKMSFNFVISTLALLSVLGILISQAIPIFDGVIAQTNSALLAASDMVADPKIKYALANSQAIIDYLPITMMGGSYLLAIIVLMIGKYAMLTNHSRDAAQIDLLSHKLNVTHFIIIGIYAVLAGVIGELFGVPALTISLLLCCFILLPFALVVELNAKAIWGGTLLFAILSIGYRFLLLLAIVMALMPISITGVIILTMLTAGPVLINMIFDVQALRLNSAL